MEYRFKIKGSYTPETLPMSRLAEYMAGLSALLGEAASVHFEKVERGSAVLVASVDSPAQPKVRERVRLVHVGHGPKDAQKAYTALDDMLCADNASGNLEEAASSDDPNATRFGVVVQFPGNTRSTPQSFGPFRQESTLDGVIIRVGGKDETASVMLQDGEVIHTGLEASRHIAKQLGHHLFGATVRLHGSGLWYKSGAGAWELRHFKIEKFDVLDDAPVSEVVKKLRSVPGNDWSRVSNPVKEIVEQRRGRNTSRDPK